VTAEHPDTGLLDLDILLLVEEVTGNLRIVVGFGLGRLEVADHVEILRAEGAHSLHTMAAAYRNRVAGAAHMGIVREDMAIAGCCKAADLVVAGHHMMGQVEHHSLAGLATRRLVGVGIDCMDRS